MRFELKRFPLWGDHHPSNSNKIKTVALNVTQA